MNEGRVQDLPQTLEIDQKWRAVLRGSKIRKCERSTHRLNHIHAAVLLQDAVRSLIFREELKARVVKFTTLTKGFLVQQAAAEAAKQLEAQQELVIEEERSDDDMSEDERNNVDDHNMVEEDDDDTTSPELLQQRQQQLLLEEEDDDEPETAAVRDSPSAPVVNDASRLQQLHEPQQATTVGPEAAAQEPQQAQELQSVVEDM